MKNFKSKYLAYDWHLPEFVKNAPGYEKMFLREIEIVRDENNKYALKIEGVNCDEDHSLDYKYDEFFHAYDAAWHFESGFTICWPKEIDVAVFSENAFLRAFKPTSLEDDKCYHLAFNEDGKFHVESLVNKYEKWLDLNAQLTEDSFVYENYLEVYQWIDTHPDFWTITYENGKLEWETTRRVRMFDSHPYREYQTNKIRWVCYAVSHIVSETSDYEYGSIHVEDAVDLESYGDTYDEALLEVAKKWFIERKWQES